jgi:hypothetical protein
MTHNLGLQGKWIHSSGLPRRASHQTQFDSAEDLEVNRGAGSTSYTKGRLAHCGGLCKKSSAATRLNGLKRRSGVSRNAIPGSKANRGFQAYGLGGASGHPGRGLAPQCEQEEARSGGGWALGRMAAQIQLGTPRFKRLVGQLVGYLRESF